MSVLAMELNDVGIRAVRDDHLGTEAMSASPGFAILDGEDLLTGYDAVRIARLKPRFTDSRFWEELDTSPLKRPFPRGLSRADLAHAHLAAIWRSVQVDVEEVILVVPGWYTRQQLGLILGISRSCGMPVTALIDSALAASATVSEGHDLLHLDLHLHRSSVTQLNRSNGLDRHRVEVVKGTGQLSFWDGWVKLICEMFLRQTRFDPLHSAEAEQTVYRRLPQWLDRLCRQESLVLTMEAGGKDYSVELGREQIVQVARPGYESIHQQARRLSRRDGKTTLLLSDRMAGLPGLYERLSEEPGFEVSWLPAGAAPAGALLAKELIRSMIGDGEDVTFITGLPRESPVPRSGKIPLPGEPRPPVINSCPTHILVDGVAYAISSQPFVLGVAIPEGDRGVQLTGDTTGVSAVHCRIFRLDDRVVVEDQSSCGTFLNGNRIEGKASCQTGDRLRMGNPGVEVQLITVREPDGPSQS